MKAVGLTCGIGSMLVGAKQAGFEVVGNIEWRTYYHTGTFEHNFGVSAERRLSDELAASLVGIDLAMGHPECGNFSVLDAANSDRSKDPGDIPLFVEMVGRVQPRFFVMDNLPGSLGAFSIQQYSEALPDYDLFPEMVSNYAYGNPQKNRKRFFLLGARREERWTFFPNEDPSLQVSVRDRIGDLCGPDGEPLGNFLNHRPHTLVGKSRGLIGLNKPGEHPTWEEVRRAVLGVPEGTVLQYFQRKTGELRPKIGVVKTYWDGHAHVLTGQSPVFHPIRGLPLTFRERARIQGFPDDFLFVGEVVEDDLSFSHERNTRLVKQTGKAMPVEFCRYVSRAIAAAIEHRELQVSNKRTKRHKKVDDAKMWYCDNVGYSDQVSACSACWLRDKCPIRTKVLQIRLPFPEKASA